MWRQRTFFFAFKAERRISITQAADIKWSVCKCPFQGSPILTKFDVERESHEVWNEAGRLPLEQWLQTSMDKTARARLKAVGNIVLPRCGRLAMHLMMHLHDGR